MKSKLNQCSQEPDAMGTCKWPTHKGWLMEFGTLLCAASLLVAPAHTMSRHNKRSHLHHNPLPIRVKAAAVNMHTMDTDFNEAGLEMRIRLANRIGGPITIRAGLVYETNENGSIHLDEAGIRISHELSL